MPSADFRRRLRGGGVRVVARFVMNTRLNVCEVETPHAAIVLLVLGQHSTRPDTYLIPRRTAFFSWLSTGGPDSPHRTRHVSQQCRPPTPCTYIHACIDMLMTGLWRGGRHVESSGWVLVHAIDFLGPWPLPRTKCDQTTRCHAPALFTG